MSSAWSEALDVLDTAEAVTFVTLWCGPEELRRRLQRCEPRCLDRAERQEWEGRLA